ncbi:MAG: hypothetical protein KME46_32965 [Brasilonema angustatum HA4187-MV1]|nr:hypothetical protein [Brasilonema angustatum HA4187-MV1]
MTSPPAIAAWEFPKLTFWAKQQLGYIRRLAMLALPVSSGHATQAERRKHAFSLAIHADDQDCSQLAERS